MNTKLLSFSVLLFTPVTASLAALTTYDPVSTGTGGYTAGNLVSQNPTASGFNGAWGKAKSWSPSDAIVDPVGLSYSNLQSSGGSFSVPNSGTRTARAFTTAVDSSSTGSIYVSFLISTGDGAGGNYSALEFSNTSNSQLDDNQRFLQLGTSTGDFGTAGIGMRILNDPNKRLTFSTTADSATHLVVLRFDLNATAASDSVTAWFDPTSLGGAEPMGAVGTITGFDTAFNYLALARFGNSLKADEFRMGTTWADVTPQSVPEPSVALLGAAAVGTSLLGRRRRSTAPASL